MSTPAKNQPLPPHIYLFYGPDSFSIAEKIAAWKNRFAEKYSAVAINVFDCEELGDEPLVLQSLKNALSGRTLFSITSLLIVKNVFSKKAETTREMLCRYLPALSSETFCVLTDEKRDPKSELSKLLTQLSKKGACSVEEFIVPAGALLKKWIVARAHQYGGSFDAPALSLFISAVEKKGYGDEEENGHLSLWHLDREIRKLVTYAGKRPITTMDIQTVSCLPSSAHVFDLSDALIGGNTRMAFLHAHHILGPYRSAVSAPLLRMLASLITQFRSFAILKNMEEDARSEHSIAETLLWNPKRVWVVRKKLVRHTTSTLHRAYAGLLDLERVIKTGSADPILSLDLWIKKTTEVTQ